MRGAVLAVNLAVLVAMTMVEARLLYGALPLLWPAEVRAVRAVGKGAAPVRMMR